MTGFLQVFARLALLVTALATVTSLFNLGFAFLLFDAGDLQPAAHERGVTRLLISNFRAVVLLHAALSMTGLVASVALLKKRRWGVHLWVGLLSVGILWCLGIVAAELLLPGAGAGAQAAGRYSRFTTLMSGVALPLSLGVGALFGWLLKKLLSAEVRDALPPR